VVQNFWHIAVCPRQRRRACQVGGNADMTSPALAELTAFWFNPNSNVFSDVNAA